MVKTEMMLDLLNTLAKDWFGNTKYNLEWMSDRCRYSTLIGYLDQDVQDMPVISKYELMRCGGNVRRFIHYVQEKIAAAELKRFQDVRKAMGMAPYKEWVVHKTVNKVTLRPYANSRSGRYRL